MDSGTSGGSMQSGSSGDDDHNDTSSFSAGAASVPGIQHQHLHLPQIHLHQPIFSSQHHLHYPSLTSSARDDNNMSGYNLKPHLSSTNSFLEALPQSDLDRIWTMNMNHNQPHAHHQQHMSYSSTSSFAPSSSPMNPTQFQTIQDPQQKPPGKVPSVTAQPGKETGSSSGRAVKKRTRASRKTPTTVLTTDTTNFRAMVQEFTGIPTPPFGPSSLFPAKKFDLFGANNGLDHPSLGSLLFSLNKSTANNIPSPIPFAPSMFTSTASQINPFVSERDQGSNPNPFQQQSQQMMLPQGSNSTTYVNLPRGDQIKNPNMPFHHSSSLPQRPTFQSKYSGSGSEADQLGAFSNSERGENDNISRTG